MPLCDPAVERAPVVSWVILKVAQRCNLNCTYCYVYNRGDQIWKTRPKRMSQTVAEAVATSISNHCSKYGLKNFVIELHGGEPLLLGKGRMRALLETFRNKCRSVQLKFILQTNGLLLDIEWLKLFDKYDIKFGISLDGPSEIADRFRVYPDGRGSTPDLLNKIAELRQATPLFEKHLSGALCVINPDTNGALMVRWMIMQGFKSFDFLLPDGTYVNLPHRWKGAAEYSRFLNEAFDYWVSLGSDAPAIRKFELMMMGLMGARPNLDALGGELRAICVVETNGAIGVLDTLRICGDNYARDQLNVFDHALDVHAEHYRLAETQMACSQCLKCPYFAACGGGYLPHRYDGVSFNNPSLYCKALFNLSERMIGVLRRELPPSVWT